MANSVTDTVQTLRQNMGAVGADALGDTLNAILDALEAVGAKLDSDGGVTDTDYATTISAIIDD
jgi:hypothetical protein